MPKFLRKDSTLKLVSCSHCCYCSTDSTYLRNEGWNSIGHSTSIGNILDSPHSLCRPHPTSKSPSPDRNGRIQGKSRDSESTTVNNPMRKRATGRASTLTNGRVKERTIVRLVTSCKSGAICRGLMHRKRTVSRRKGPHESAMERASVRHQLSVERNLPRPLSISTQLLNFAPTAGSHRAELVTMSKVIKETPW